MVRKRKLHIALLLAGCLLCALLSGFAADPGGGAVAEPAAIHVYLDGILNAECPYIDGEPRMTLEAFAALLELPYADGAIDGTALHVAGDGAWAELDGRYFYLPSGLLEHGGETLWPVEALARAFACTAQWDAATRSINIDATARAPLESGESYYDADDVYWLSRIIFAESGNQPLEGMLGVGNVVLARVASPSFPDSVYEVIFDRRYGVQFSPVETGSIYNEPSELAVVAAKLCLEGCDVAEGCLYFVNPELGLTQWFRDTRSFVVSIGDHDFYA